jgi:hypothetical protein
VVIEFACPLKYRVSIGGNGEKDIKKGNENMPKCMVFVTK